MSSDTDPTPKPVFSKQQILLIGLLLVGYSGYYLCRSNLSIATPLLIEEFGKQGVTKTTIGGIVSLATLFYAFGKFVSGSLADRVGGRTMFLTGMIGAALCSIIFALGGLPIFTIVWSLNRAVQSAGWVGMVKISSRWFSYSVYGTVMGIVSLSFLIGDSLSRLFLGQLVVAGMGWRGLFITSGAVMAAIFTLSLFLLKETPSEVGEPEPEVNPANAYAEAGNSAETSGLMEILVPLMKNPMFWIVCGLSLGFTLLRDTFNTWIPQYLTEVVKMSKGDAGRASALFPFFGGVSTIIAGLVSDKLGKTGRALIILLGIILSIPALLVLSKGSFTGAPLFALTVLGAIAFLLLGPYSFLAGAISLDFGGKKGSATACGWIDGVGYLGAIFAGKGIGSIAEKQGWSTAFLVLTGVAGFSLVAALAYFIMQRKATAAEKS